MGYTERGLHTAKLAPLLHDSTTGAEADGSAEKTAADTERLLSPATHSHREVEGK